MAEQNPTTASLPEGATILCGDALETLRALPDASAHCCVTSPPYWGLREYKAGPKEIGKEKTPEEFVANLVAVFQEVRRVLQPDGTLWVNLGDSYFSRPNGSIGKSTLQGSRAPHSEYRRTNGTRKTRHLPEGVKHKDMVGIPWMTAFALRADGWYLRRDIIWHKLSAMPESVKDRPTTAHEYVFLLSASERYYYDAEAIEEEAKDQDLGMLRSKPRADPSAKASAPSLETRRAAGVDSRSALSGRRSKRSVWPIAAQPYAGAHCAVMPPDLVEPCILAGCPVGGVVLDPFAGACTTGLVALRNGRGFVGIELNPETVEEGRARMGADAQIFVAQRQARLFTAQATQPGLFG